MNRDDDAAYWRAEAERWEREAAMWRREAHLGKVRLAYGIRKDIRKAHGLLLTARSPREKEAAASTALALLSGLQHYVEKLWDEES
jgi:hypothetical protein